MTREEILALCRATYTVAQRQSSPAKASRKK